MLLLHMPMGQKAKSPCAGPGVAGQPWARELNELLVGPHRNGRFQHGCCKVLGIVEQAEPASPRQAKPTQRPAALSTAETIGKMMTCRLLL